MKIGDKVRLTKPQCGHKDDYMYYRNRCIGEIVDILPGAWYKVSWLDSRALRYKSDELEASC